MTDQSYIVATNGKCHTFVGPDATRYFQAEMLASSLKLYAATKIIPTRGVTATKMLALASQITGQTFRRGQYLMAAHAVKAWANKMKAALPVINEI